MRKFLPILSILICVFGCQEAVAQKRGAIKKKPKPTIISCGVCNQKAIFLPKPEYPTGFGKNISGAVSVQILIGEKGNVMSAKAISGHPLLRLASEQAALKAKFEPTILGKKHVRVFETIVYNFTR
jgi:hypothetical protein